VNNAGNAGPTSAIGRGAHFWEQPRDDWDRFFRTNLHGVMNCCHAAMPGMVELKKGRIVTIVSDAGRVGGAGLVTYSAAKSGASGFVRALAREAGRFGITCNAISLSSMLPDMSEAERAQANASEKSKPMLSQYIIRRFGSPDDVSTMAVFLCSDSSSWITGQNYPVNGGFSLAI
jgi:NAD(P)-dependent dehydrogenase (short-subunit alcohol dehydrogenase family)